jgi:hypothetical protein
MDNGGGPIRPFPRPASQYLIISVCYNHPINKSRVRPHAGFVVEGVGSVNQAADKARYRAVIKSL